MGRSGQWRKHTPGGATIEVDPAVATFATIVLQGTAPFTAASVAALPADGRCSGAVQRSNDPGFGAGSCTPLAGAVALAGNTLTIGLPAAVLLAS